MAAYKYKRTTKKRRLECGEASPHSVSVSVDLGLIAWTVLDTLHLQLLLDVFGNTALDCDRI